MQTKTNIPLNEVSAVLATLREFVNSPDTSFAQLQDLRDDLTSLNGIITHKIRTALMASRK
ncbi:MAG: hypothetical protein HFJ28_03095 [Clostridia bacterium]|jgi:hypothetical protein|nr:hypothetical protein [Clostridia bacterium]